MKNLFLLLFLFLSSLCLEAQVYSTQNKKAIKYYEKGFDAFQKRNGEEAEKWLLKAVKVDSTFSQAQLALGVLYKDMGDVSKGIYHYRKSLEGGRSFRGTTYFELGHMEFFEGDYKPALEHLEYYVNKTVPDPGYKKLAERSIANCKFAIRAMENPVPFNPVNLGENVNSEFPEYFPSITVDNGTLLFTRRIAVQDYEGAFQEDFYTSHLEEGDWGMAFNIGPPINTLYNEGAPTLSADGQLLIFTACGIEGNFGEGRTGVGSCDLFYSFKVGDEWTRPRNLGESVNTWHWESQPSYSADGKTLYFVRRVKKQGRLTQQDIFSCEVLPSGGWSKPKKLNDNINTLGREESVMIHPDGQTLYFSSDGHTGMGGLDIYMSKIGPDGDWGPAINLGYPINTYMDENSLLVSPDGEFAIFASDREGGFGDLDLYRFDMPDHLKPEPLTYMKGKVYDAKTKRPLSGKFELKDLGTGKTVVRSSSDPVDGGFMVTLPVNKNYALIVEKDGYLLYSENFELSGGTIEDPFIKDVPLLKAEVGQKMVLKNIFFETASYALKDASMVELGKVEEYMKKNSKISFEVGGHTDNQGGKEYNQKLSQNRAKAVYEYLVQQGIEKSRLTFVGYGQGSPITENDTEEGRAQNRRTEFKVTGN